MTRYSTYADDFYINVNLNTEMDLSPSRETMLHFFEQLRKRYPAMKNFYNRDRGEYVLEEDKDRGHYRWAAVEPRRISSGVVNPASVEAALEQHVAVLDMVPYTLAISSLDCESLSYMFGFDFTYRGNHNALLAEALGVTPAFERMVDLPGASLVAYEPAIQFALDEDCRTQFRLCVESRTSVFHVRSGEYPEDQLSVYLTLRRFGALESGQTYTSVIEQLGASCQELVDGYVIEHILVPLQQAIATK